MTYNKIISPESLINSLVKGIERQLAEHIPDINDSLNHEIDQYNQAIDELEKAERQRDENANVARKVAKERDLLIEKRREDEKDVIKIVELTRKVKDENKTLAAELKELRSLNPKKLKAQIERLKESAKAAAAKEKTFNTKINEANARAKRVEHKYSELAEIHNANIDTMRKMHEFMQLEGATCEEQFSSDEGGFYIYRKPTGTDTKYHAKGDDDIVPYPFYFDVQTDKGISFHIVMLSSGKVGYPNCGFEVPKEVGDYCLAQYQANEDREFTVTSKVGNQSEIDALLSKFEEKINEFS